MKWYSEWEPRNLPRPSLYAAVAAGGPDCDDTLYFGLELRTAGCDAIASVEARVTWNRPRPWKMDVQFPFGGVSEFVWRRPQ